MLYLVLNDVFFQTGKTLTASVEGDATPSEVWNYFDHFTVVACENDIRSFLENYIIDTNTVERVGHCKTRHSPANDDDFERRGHFEIVLATK
jgi:hypothetical protein